MEFGLFLPCEQPPWQASRAALKDAIDQAAYADALGFDAVWLAEHHFSEYGDRSGPRPRRTRGRRR